MLLYPVFTGGVRRYKVSVSSVIVMNPISYHCTVKLVDAEPYAMWTVGSSKKKLYIDQEYQCLVLKTLEDIPDNVDVVLDYPEFFTGASSPQPDQT